MVTMSALIKNIDKQVILGISHIMREIPRIVRIATAHSVFLNIKVRNINILHFGTPILCNNVY